MLLYIFKQEKEGRKNDEAQARRKYVWESLHDQWHSIVINVSVEHRWHSSVFYRFLCVYADKMCTVDIYDRVLKSFFF